MDYILLDTLYRLAHTQQYVQYSGSSMLGGGNYGGSIRRYACSPDLDGVLERQRQQCPGAQRLQMRASQALQRVVEAHTPVWDEQAGR